VRQKSRPPSREVATGPEVRSEHKRKIARKGYYCTSERENRPFWGISDCHRAKNSYVGVAHLLIRSGVLPLALVLI
jgi:hypothetical protein